MRLANVTLVFVLYVTSIAGTTIITITDTIQAGLITMRHTIGSTAIEFKATGAFTYIRCYTATLVAAKLTNWLTNIAIALVANITATKTG